MFYISFDTETTGLQPGSRINEIAAMKMDLQGNVVDCFSKLVNPGMPLPADAQAVNRIDAQSLKDAPPASEVLPEWLEFIKGATFGLAHFAQYDMGVIGWELGRAGLCLPSLPIVCTWKLAKTVGTTPNNKLATLVEHYKIKTSGDAHRALADADACRQYYDIASKLAKPISEPWATSYGYTAHLPESMIGLRDAISEGRQVSFNYVDKSGASSSRKITPYGWALQGNGVYFHGLCHLRNERREFLANNVSNFAVLP